MEKLTHSQMRIKYLKRIINSMKEKENESLKVGKYTFDLSLKWKDAFQKLKNDNSLAPENLDDYIEEMFGMDPTKKSEEYGIATLISLSNMFLYIKDENNSSRIDTILKEISDFLDKYFPDYQFQFSSSNANEYIDFESNNGKVEKKEIKNYPPTFQEAIKTLTKHKTLLKPIEIAGAINFINANLEKIKISKNISESMKPEDAIILPKIKKNLTHIINSVEMAKGHEGGKTLLTIVDIPLFVAHSAVLYLKILEKYNLLPYIVNE